MQVLAEIIPDRGSQRVFLVRPRENKADEGGVGTPLSASQGMLCLSNNSYIITYTQIWTCPVRPFKNGMFVT